MPSSGSITMQVTQGVRLIQLLLPIEVMRNLNQQQLSVTMSAVCCRKHQA